MAYMQASGRAVAGKDYFFVVHFMIMNFSAKIVKGGGRTKLVLSFFMWCRDNGSGGRKKYV